MDTKHCNKCHIDKPLTEFYYRKDKNIYNGSCKLFQKEYHAIYDRKGLDYYDKSDGNLELSCQQCLILTKKVSHTKSKEQIILDRQKRFPSLIPTGILKYCGKCKTEKDESEFPITKSTGVPERLPYCKICSNRKKI